MRTVVVTGSSRGIGLAIARAFAAAGDRVVLNCKSDEAQLKASVAELREEFGDCVTGFRANLADYKDCASFFREAEATFGPAEILINNAGAAYYGLFSQMPPAEMQDCLAANLTTAMNASHRAIPHMVRTKSGCIINITSIWGIKGASCEAAYSAAKAGVIGLTKALAKELAPSNIRVNAIACGAIETRMNGHLTPQEKTAFAEEIPLGRFGQTHEVGGLAVFLASQAASYLTGQIIPLDGGYL